MVYASYRQYSGNPSDFSLSIQIVTLRRVYFEAGFSVLQGGQVSTIDTEITLIKHHGSRIFIKEELINEVFYVAADHVQLHFLARLSVTLVLDDEVSDIGDAPIADIQQLGEVLITELNPAKLGDGCCIWEILGECDGKVGIAVIYRMGILVGQSRVSPG